MSDDPVVTGDAFIAALGLPIHLKAMSLANRLVMAPMTRKMSPGGVPDADVAMYYRRRAEAGVGLIITEGVAIDHPGASSHEAIPHFYGESALSGWSSVCAAVHAAGGRIVPQLWHVGMLRVSGLDPVSDQAAVGPSGVTDRSGREISGPLTDAEIAVIVTAYGSAARDARRLGFDGVELHAAHGYLIDQFFWDQTNRRSDRYGGDLVRRTRFAVDIVAECRRQVGPEFPILFRFSQWKLQDYTARLVTSPSELEQLLAPLVDAGVDVFDCSTRYFAQHEFSGSDLPLAAWTKKITGKPVIAVGGVGQRADFLSQPAQPAPQPIDYERLASRVSSGEIDLIAVGRALLADAQWYRKVALGRADTVRPYTRAALHELS